MGSSRPGPRSEISHTKRPLALPTRSHVRPAAVTVRVDEDLAGREEHPVRASPAEAGRGQCLRELRARCAQSPLTICSGVRWGKGRAWG